MKNKVKSRNSNIELLRILAILGVIVLHYNNSLYGGALDYSKSNLLNNSFLYFLESIFVCSVDLFMIISGYYLCQKDERNIWKIIELFVQVIIFKVLIFFTKFALGITAFSIKELICSFIPSNYFIVFYSVVYLISPYISIIINKLSKKELKKMVFMLIIIFSFLPTIVDCIEFFFNTTISGMNTISISGDQSGYNIVNFILCWIIGAYLYKSNFSLSKKKSISTFLLISIMTTILSKWLGLDRVTFSYCNPLVLFASILIFMFFKECNLKENKIINNLSKASLITFLIHIEILPFIKIKEFATANIFLLVAHIVLSATIIYVLCYFIYLMYNTIKNIFIKNLK